MRVVVEPDDVRAARIWASRGFEVLSDPWMSLEEAAARRDFTINAMAIDPVTEDLLENR